MAKQLNLIYAISKNSNIVHISEVASGAACDCTCPSCSSKLIAKKGKEKSHHFAHDSKTSCEYGYQTSLHMAAKEILFSAQSMLIPEVILPFKGLHRIKTISPERKINIDHVELEQKTGSIIPDIVIQCGNRKLFVEIFVTHKTDNSKLEKIKELDISTIEIDLSKCTDNITKDSLKEILLDTNKNKYWVYNSVINKNIIELYRQSKRRKIDEASYVKNCPLCLFKFYRHFCANLTDCYSCIYCIEQNDEEEYIVCTGEQLFSDIKDIGLSIEERKEKAIRWIENRDREYIEYAECPYCDYGTLTKKENAEIIEFECNTCNSSGIYNKKTSKITTSDNKREKNLNRMVWEQKIFPSKPLLCASYLKSNNND